MRIEYYFYGKLLYGIKNIIVNKIDYVICEDGDGYLEIHPFKDLRKWEDTWEFKDRQKQLLEQKAIKEQRVELEKQLRESAVKTLITRMMFNMALSQDGELNPIGLHIVEELKKIINDQKIKPNEK